MSYDLILFDFDGVIADTAAGLVSSFRHGLAEVGVEEPNDALLRSFIGFPLIESLRKHYALSEQAMQQVIARYRAHTLTEGRKRYTLYPGVTTLLRQLKKQGKTLALATTRMTDTAITLAKDLGVHEYFDLIEGDSDGSYQEKAETIAACLRAFPTMHKHITVMVGDRKHDIIAACKNGIDAIAVTYGYGSLEELENAKPTVIVKTPEELQAVL